LLPFDSTEITQVEADALRAPTPEEVKRAYINGVSNEIQNIMDAEALMLGYDSIHTAVSYAEENAVPSFKADGVSFRKWRSNVWAYCYAALAQYESDLGSDPQTVAPTIDEMIAGMPTRV